MKPNLLRAAIILLCCSCAPLSAQTQPGPLPDDHPHPRVLPIKSFAEGWLRLNDSLRTAEDALKDGALADLSAEANTVAELAAQIGGLVISKNSPVPAERSKETSLAIRDVGAAAIALHLAADSGNLLRSRALMTKLQDAVQAADGFAPASYFCPMHCEGAKTYDLPGTCPVCAMNLKKITSARHSVTVTPGAPLAPGEPVPLTFEIKDPTGARLANLEVVHEKLLHLLMVSDDLSWYAHEHPEIQPDGTFTLTYAFPRAGRYILFNDFTPRDVGMQVVPVTITVPGEAPAPVTLVADLPGAKVIDGYTVSLDTRGQLVAGAPSFLRYVIARDGKPVVDLEPYLGAMGHLIIVSQNLRHFVHSHPKELKPAGPPGRRGPSVEFEAFFDRPGMYKAWAQFQHKGTILTFPFIFEVATARETTPPAPPAPPAGR